MGGIANVQTQARGCGLYFYSGNLISAMYIHDQDNIEIVWKFGDIFDEAEISKVIS